MSFETILRKNKLELYLILGWGEGGRFTLTLMEPHCAEFTSQVFLDNSLCHYPVTERPRNVFLLLQSRQFLFTALESQTHAIFLCD